MARNIVPRQASGKSARWESPREAAGAPFRYVAGVLDDLAPGGLYVLRGPRRVGKSVELKRTIEALIAAGTAPRGIVHAAVNGWRAADLGRLVSAAGLLTPPCGRRYWFIDEITGITDGSPERIKWLRDNDARFRGDTVVLTGSSASDLTAYRIWPGARDTKEHKNRVPLVPFVPQPPGTARRVVVRSTR